MNLTIKSFLSQVRLLKPIQIKTIIGQEKQSLFRPLQTYLQAGWPSSEA